MKLIFRPFNFNNTPAWIAPYSSKNTTHRFVFMNTFRMMMGRIIDSSYGVKK